MGYVQDANLRTWHSCFIARFNAQKLINYKKEMTKKIISLIKKRFLPHKHKWQIRGRNRYGVATYRICLKCRETFERVNEFYEEERWEKCEPIAELDSQFDSNDRYVFKSLA